MHEIAHNLQFENYPIKQTYNEETGLEKEISDYELCLSLQERKLRSCIRPLTSLREQESKLNCILSEVQINKDRYQNKISLNSINPKSYLTNSYSQSIQNLKKDDLSKEAKKKLAILGGFYKVNGEKIWNWEDRLRKLEEFQNEKINGEEYTAIMNSLETNKKLIEKHPDYISLVSSYIKVNCNDHFKEQYDEYSKQELEIKRELDSLFNPIAEIESDFRNFKARRNKTKINLDNLKTRLDDLKNYSHWSVKESAVPSRTYSSSIEEGLEMKRATEESDLNFFKDLKKKKYEAYLKNISDLEEKRKVYLKNLREIQKKSCEDLIKGCEEYYKNSGRFWYDDVKDSVSNKFSKVKNVFKTGWNKYENIFGVLYEPPWVSPPEYSKNLYEGSQQRLNYQESLSISNTIATGLNSLKNSLKKYLVPKVNLKLQLSRAFSLFF